MNARELIDALSKVHPDTPVVISTAYDGGDSLVTRLRAEPVHVVVEDDSYPNTTFYRELSDDELDELSDDEDANPIAAFGVIAQHY